MTQRLGQINQDLSLHGLFTLLTRALTNPAAAGTSITTTIFNLPTGWTIPGATQNAGSSWTVTTTDGSRAAHWEHTVAVTETGPRILTVA